MFDTTVKVPLQQNYYDCGIFVLQYVQQFLSKPFEIFKMPIDLSQWFEQSVIQTKRMELRNLIFQLSKQMQSNNGHNKSVEQQSIEMLAVTGQPEVKKSKSNHDICENEAQSPKSSKKYKNLNEDEDIQIDENINFDDISVHKSKRKQTKTNDKANLISHKLPIKSASAATTNIKPQCEILFDQLMNDDINNNNNRNNDDNRQNDSNNDNETFSYKPKSFYGASENSKRQSNKKTYEIMNSLDNLN
jgi:hypothetical protein